MAKEKIAFFDTKPYDRVWFERLGGAYEFVFYDTRLNADTAKLAAGCDGVCAFVNDELDAGVIDALSERGVRVIAMRCAGYSNVDFHAAFGKINVLRVPAYSPHAVAEHAFALLLCLNRKIHRAYIRTRDFNFNIAGLTGVDLYGKTAGVVGTGRIGRAFIDICRGFGMHVVAYDAYPAADSGIEYVALDELFRRSDIISLHCPLNDASRHMLSAAAFAAMKDGVFVLNTSRGALIDTEALIEALNSGKVRGAGLDVYEEEADLFYEDRSGTIIRDDQLALLISKPNVILTSHQGFLTEEALENIARTTLGNLDEFFSGGALSNEVCYDCERRRVSEHCAKNGAGRCF